MGERKQNQVSKPQNVFTQISCKVKYQCKTSIVFTFSFQFVCSSCTSWFCCVTMFLHTSNFKLQSTNDVLSIQFWYNFSEYMFCWLKIIFFQIVQFSFPCTESSHLQWCHSSSLLFSWKWSTSKCTSVCSSVC